MEKRIVKYWLVEAKKRKVYPFFEGKKRVTANDLNDLAEFRRKLQNENPNDNWCICTNEYCYNLSEGVFFSDGVFL